MNFSKAGFTAVLILCLSLPAVSESIIQSSFKKEQMRYPRARQAYQEKEGGLRLLFKERKTVYPPKQKVPTFIPIGWVFKD
jgi:hypothetical protein